MNKVRIRVRAEAEDDYSRITLIHDFAFSESNEGRLVWLLRETLLFDRELSLVAEADSGSVVGHVLFYPIFIKTGSARLNVLTLAPLAVLPGYQRMGVGMELVSRGLEVAKNRGHSSVVVLGNPAFYARFGFRPARTWNVSPPFRVSGNAYMALELEANALLHAGGTAIYPREFDGV